MGIRIVSIIVLLAMIIGGVRTTQAKEYTAAQKQEAEETYLEAKRHFEVGDFATALDLFKRVYVLTEKAELLYNVAQCWRQLGENAKAIKVFGEYLKHFPAGKTSDEVRTIIADLKQLPPRPIPQRPVAPTPQVAPRPTPQPTPPPPPVIIQPDVPPNEVPAPEPAPTADLKPNRGRGMLIAGIVVGTIGLGALGAGIALEVRAQEMADEISNGHYETEFDNGPLYAALGPVLIGVGGAAVVTGVILTVVGARRSKRSRVALIPSVSPRRVAVNFGITF